MLYQLGAVQFEVAPVNVDRIERKVGADYAAKDIIGAPRPREFTGEADETVKLHGTLFPHRFGGLDGLSTLQAMAVAGEPQMLIRGDGYVYGWYLIEEVSDKATFLDREGVGRVIEFDVSLFKSPRSASSGSMLSMLMSLFG